MCLHFRMMLLSFISWSVLSLVTAESNLRECHSTEPRPYIYHATKTPYELINNEDSSPIFVAGKSFVVHFADVIVHTALCSRPETQSSGELLLSTQLGCTRSDESVSFSPPFSSCQMVPTFN